MAEKDITEKILMLYADVFADCINVLQYNGEQRLTEENTKPAPTESFYKGQKAHNQLCDASRYLLDDKNIIAQYIIENATRLSERQILRKVSYEGGAYRQQLESSMPVHAVICIVIAWSGKTNRIPLSLRRLLGKNGVPARELEQVDDAKLTVYHMHSLPPEVRKRFVSDMGFVVDYLNEGNFEGRKNQKIIHLEALCDMMKALTGDTRFTEQVAKLLEKEQKEGHIMMCEYINALEARGEAAGAKKGEAKLSSLLQQLYALGRDDDAKLAVQDLDARARLYKEFSIPNYIYENKQDNAGEHA